MKRLAGKSTGQSWDTNRSRETGSAGTIHLHARIRREINCAKIGVWFSPKEVVSTDSEMVRIANAHYDEVFQAARDFQRQVDKEDDCKRARHDD